MNDANSDEIMETSCPHCASRFRVSEHQIQLAMGQVQCGECGKIFDAWESLKYEDDNPQVDDQIETAGDTSKIPQARPELSLHEAMYGDRRSRILQFAPLFWLVGILMLAALGIAQTIYYQRFSLIENSRYQKQVLSLCQLVPCNESQFSSTQHIKLLDRNVFTHPVESSALMVTGSFVNQAIFDQKLPKLLVSLFDLQGKMIANRLFTPSEYLQTDKNRRLMEVAKPVQFRLEISDPGTDALTYEFEFL